ncbi:MAG: metalloregulator ArsR/SmtB family transcription factor [Myxococcota bacterium]
MSIKSSALMDEGGFAKVFRALGHPNRLRLFTEIWKNGNASYEDGHVCFLHEVMERLNVGAPTVSHHLKTLVDAGLITTAKQGKFVTCRVNPKALEELRIFFARG